MSEKNPANKTESRKEIHVGDYVFLTDAGVRKLLVRGFAGNEFSAETPLEVIEIIKHSPKDFTYMALISEADGARVDFGRDEIDFPSE